MGKERGLGRPVRMDVNTLGLGRGSLWLGDTSLRTTDTVANGDRPLVCRCLSGTDLVGLLTATKQEEKVYRIPPRHLGKPQEEVERTPRERPTAQADGRQSSVDLPGDTSGGRPLC